MDDHELKVTTTPPAEEAVNKDAEKEFYRFLAHTSTNNKSFVVRDRTGLRLSFACLLPITTGDNGEQRIWGASIILNSAELEFPQVHYKLRVAVKKRFNPHITCNRSRGTIKQNDIFALTYQLPESSIDAVSLTLVVDGSPHEVPLCKFPKADYLWIGKETAVPGPVQLLENRKKCATPETESTVKNVSPGRFENIPEGIRDFLFAGKGLESVGKLLYPHTISLFRDLSKVPFTGNFDLTGSGNKTDVIAEEIVRRFHEDTREKFTTTPALLQNEES